MSVTTLERVDLTTTTQDSDHDRVRHYAADREQFDRASLGAPFVALCGMTIKHPKAPKFTGAVPPMERCAVCMSLKWDVS